MYTRQKPRRQGKKYSNTDVAHALVEKALESSYTGFLLSGTCLFGVSALYVSTLHPTVVGGNSGELVSAIYEWGVPHPPGYPIYIILGKIFQVLFQFSDPAWAVGLLSALTGGAAGSLLCMIVYRLTSSPCSSVFAALSFALSRPVWTWSITAEIFALNNLFVVMIVLWSANAADTIKTEEKASSGTLQKVVCQIWLLFGLSLCNQTKIFVYVIFIAAWSVLELVFEKLLSVRLALKMVGSLALGLMPYIYLPIAGNFSKSQVLWGDHSSIGGVLFHVFRCDYGSCDSRIFSTNKNCMQNNLVRHSERTVNEFTWPVVLLAVIGTLCGHRFMRRHFRRLLLVWTVMVLVYIIFLAWHCTSNIEKPYVFEMTERYWLQSDVMLCLFAGLGLSVVIKWFQFGKEHTRLNFNVPSRLGQFFTAALIAYQLQRNWPQCNQSQNTLMRDFARQALAVLPKNAIVLPENDMMAMLYSYSQVCDRIRPDIRLLVPASLSLPWYVKRIKSKYKTKDLYVPGDILAVGRQKTEDMLPFTLKHLFDANSDKKIFFCSRPVWYFDNSWINHYQAVPYGLCRQLLKPDKVHSKIDLDEYMQVGQHIYKWNVPYKLPPVFTGSNPTKFRLSTSDETVSDVLWKGREHMIAHIMKAAIQVNPKNDEAGKIQERLRLLTFCYQKLRRLLEVESKKFSVRIGAFPHSLLPVPPVWYRDLAFTTMYISNTKPRKRLEYAKEAQRYFAIFFHLTEIYKNEISKEDMRLAKKAASQIDPVIRNLTKNQQTGKKTKGKSPSKKSCRHA
ncbi:protein O-mannosyl-transferase TMEM260-like isoform X1 [Clavelina lepadiformis]|uniref:protein O-mannosyl-transferase TMEM260-like isoform X1 n=1 Tax=Clavelina lepadiformis TaxID=159417 RepID=UPI004040F721